MNSFQKWADNYARAFGFVVTQRGNWVELHKDGEAIECMSVEGVQNACGPVRLKLFFCQMTDWNENFDLFVSAPDEATAVALWLAYFDDPQLTRPDLVREALQVAATAQAHAWE